MPSKQLAKNTYQKFLDDIAGIHVRAPRESIMEPHGLKPWVIRRHVTSAESAVAPRLFAAFIHGLKSRGILRRRITETEADDD